MFYKIYNMKKLYTILALSLIWFSNAIYLSLKALSYKAWNTSEFFCDINNSFSCSTLFSFDFSRVFWIPYPIISSIVYPIIFIIALLWLKKIINKPLKIIFFIWLLGMCFNWYLIYNEFLVSTFCPLCIFCTLIITIITIIGWTWFKK